MPTEQPSESNHGSLLTLPGRREASATALVWAFLLHLLIGGWILENAGHGLEAAPPAVAQLEVVMEPEVSEEDLFRYVRAAPNVLESLPDDTINISDRDQQAAQEKEAEELSFDNTPQIEGDLEESNRLIQGDPRPAQERPAPPEAGASSGQSPMPQMQAAPRSTVLDSNQQESSSGIAEALQEDAEESGVAVLGSEEGSAEERESNPESGNRTAVVSQSNEDGQGRDRLTTPPQGASEEGTQPRPRPRLQRDTSFGPLKNSLSGAVRVGRLAFDSQYSEFGEYWRRVAEIIEARWRNLVYNSRSIPFGGYRVTVAFTITRSGDVTGLRVESSTAEQLAEVISMDAIEGEAPFFEWSPEMILQMGESTECRITFFY